MIHFAFAAEHIPVRSCVSEIFNDLNQEINNKFRSGYNAKFCPVPFLNRYTASSLAFFSNFHFVLFRLLYRRKTRTTSMRNNAPQYCAVALNVCIFMWCLTACLGLAISIFAFCMGSGLKASSADSRFLLLFVLFFLIFMSL